MSGFGSQLQALHPWPVSSGRNLQHVLPLLRRRGKRKAEHVALSRQSRDTTPTRTNPLRVKSFIELKRLDQKLDQGVAVKLEELPSVNAQVPVKLEVGEEPLSTEGGNGKRTIEQVGHSEQSSNRPRLALAAEVDDGSLHEEDAKEADDQQYRPGDKCPLHGHEWGSCHKWGSCQCNPRNERRFRNQSARKFAENNPGREFDWF